MSMLDMKKRISKTNRKHFFVVFLVTMVLGSIYIITPPRQPNTEVLVHIPNGYSIIETAELLEQERIIRSKYFFRFIVQTLDKPIQAGTYQFTDGISVFRVTERILAGEYGDVQVVITIPEGSTHADIEKIIATSELDVDVNTQYIPEGYLFPDTYYFFRGTDSDTLLKTLQDNFELKYRQAKEGSTLDKSQLDSVIMASLLEKEAGSDVEEKQIISGILWKRLQEGKRLQVDAPFLYDAGAGITPLRRASQQPDSGYNTYTRYGLTTTAIGNPGYDSLYAAMHPLYSPYYFYLHAPDGRVYYAETHDDHLKNIRMYLR